MQGLEELLLQQQQMLFQISTTVTIILAVAVLILVFRVGSMENRLVKRISYVINRSKKGDEAKIEGVFEKFWNTVFESIVGGEGGLTGAIKRTLNIGKKKKEEKEPTPEDLNTVPLQY